MYAVMYNVNADVLEQRAPQFKNKKPKGHFTSPGLNYLHSLDGHDKLMGFRNSIFPVAIHGCKDTCSRESTMGKGVDW